MTLAAAGAPLVVVLAAMWAMRWSAAAAGAAGLLVTLAVSLVAFDPAATALEAIGPAPALTGALAEALHSAATILWIVFPAIAIYELQNRSGALERIRDALAAVSGDRMIQVVLIAWFFGLFMEGAAGFGAPVALVAPLLVGIGYAPITAVAMALVGHAAGVSFGASGTPVLAQAEITGASAYGIGVKTALLHATLGSLLLIFLMRMAGAAMTLRNAAWTALAAACFLAPFLAIAILAGPELPTFGGALLGAIIFVIIVKWRGPMRTERAEYRLLAPDVAPYLVILALVIVSRLITPIQDTLSVIGFAWSLHGTYRGAFHPLYHPGTILLAGFVLGALLTGRAVYLAPAARSAAVRLIPVGAALLTILAMSRLMIHSGMISALADGAARSGSFWPLLAPAIGVLGSFVTGSATASNILFTPLKLNTATAVALSPTMMAAAQGFGAAIGNVIAPHNVIAGAATVGLQRCEGDILARTMGVCICYTAAGGLLVLAATSLSR